MNGFYNNPYQNQLYQSYIQPLQQAQTTNVVKVNGKPGAEAYQLGPNSSALLLDETAAMVWLVQTDGAGYKTSTAYDIIPHKEVKQEDMFKKLEDRITKLEDKVNAKSNSTDAKSRKSAE